MNFSKILTLWYSKNKRDLPWRNTRDPYKIWLSEIILQQTQVKQGLPYYESFLKAFPSVVTLANAKEEDVLKLWQGLGYYSRARNLHDTAKIIHKELNNEFPNSYSGLIKLKGIGDYTASAIASFCYNAPCAVVDGNVYRVLSRIFGIDTPINSSKGIKLFKILAEDKLNKVDSAIHNQAIMEFGALQCKPKNPLCETCPFNDHCMAFRKNLINTLPVKTSKTKVSKRYFNFLVFIDNQKNTVLEKRTQKGIWQNLYQFPLVEATHNVNINEISELKITAYIKNNPFELKLYNSQAIVHKLSHQHLNVKFWIIETTKINAHTVKFKDLEMYAVPVVISRFIEEFKNQM